MIANTGDAADTAAERNVTSLRRRQRRSVSVERNVETLVVVDRTMMEYYKNEDIENYVLTIMNMVHHSLATHHHAHQTHYCRHVGSPIYVVKQYWYF